MNTTKYCPAYLLNEQAYDDPESCLGARGLGEAQAREFIELARHLQSEIVVPAAEVAAEELFLVIAEDDGRWRTWAGRANAMQDTREAAERLVESFHHDVEWRVFGVPAVSETRKAALDGKA